MRIKNWNFACTETLRSLSGYTFVELHKMIIKDACFFFPELMKKKKKKKKHKKKKKKKTIFKISDDFLGNAFHDSKFQEKKNSHSANIRFFV